MTEKPPPGPTDDSDQPEEHGKVEGARKKPDRSIQPPRFERAMESYVPRGQSATPRKVAREQDGG